MVASVLEHVAAAAAFDKAQYASTSTLNRPVPSDPSDDPEGFIFEAEDDDDWQALQYCSHFDLQGPPGDYGCELSGSDSMRLTALLVLSAFLA